MNPLAITTEEVQGEIWDLHCQIIVLKREIVALRAQLAKVVPGTNGTGEAQYAEGQASQR